MTIQYKCDTAQGKCYVKKHMPDWDILRGCFPRNIRPTDIDGAVEINGHILFLEWKGKGASLTHGQQIMFCMMTKHAPKQQVLIIYGEPGHPEEFQVIQSGKSRFREKCTLEVLRWHCEMWGQWADGRGEDAA